MLLRNAAWNYGGAFADLGTGALLLALITRYLPTSEYGLLILVVSIVQLLTLLDGGVLGVLTPVCVEIMRDRGQAALSRFLGTVLTLGTLLGATLSALLLAITSTLNATSGSNVFGSFGPAQYLPLLAYVPAVFATSIAVRALESLQEYKAISVAQISSSLLRFGVVCFAVLTVGGFESVLAAYAATAWFQALLLIRYVHKRLGYAIPITLADVARLRALWRTSRFAAVDALARQTIFGTDALVLALFGSMTSVAWLGVAQKIPCAIWVAIERMAGVTLAPMTQNHLEQNRSAVRSTFFKTTRLLFAFVFPVTLALGLGATAIITLWAGPEYGPAAVAMRWLLLTVLLLSLSVPAIVLLYAVGNIRVSARLAVLEGAANLLLSVILAPRFGAVGVAFATALTHAAVTLVFLLPAACAAVDLPLRTFASQIGKDVALPGAVLSSVLVVMVVAPSLPFSLLAGGTVMGAMLYSVLWYRQVGVRMSLSEQPAELIRR